MKNLKFLLLLLFLLIGVGCNTNKTNWFNIGTEGVMQVEYIKMFTQQQLDSICIADTLPLNIDDWIHLDSRDYETGKIIRQYIFYRNNNFETIYTVSKIENENKYLIQKRSVK